MLAQGLAPSRKRLPSLLFSFRHHRLSPTWPGWVASQTPISHANGACLARGGARSYSSPKELLLEVLGKDTKKSPSPKTGPPKTKTLPPVSSEPSPEPKKTLPPVSSEQQVAIDTLLHTKDNIIVSACAGSGKTTTILHLAQAAPETKFLVLVYNNRLMKETQARVGALGMSNITILTYHTLGYRWYTSECANDQGLKRVVEDDMPVKYGLKLPDFSFLIMDEQQDMTPIMKRFVDKVILDRARTSGGELRVGVFGDPRQELYGFGNADSRFLTLADRPEVFGYVNGHAWKRISLTTSMRITKPQADFINQQLLKNSDTVLRANRTLNAQGTSCPKPRYVVCNPYEDVKEEVLRLCGMGIAPDDIIVLTPSARNRYLAVGLANEIALADLPVFRSDSDFQDISPTVAKGKILICTNHQAKGIERKAAIVLHFDQSYYDIFDRGEELPTTVSNPQYVAVTRSYEHLVLIHNHKKTPLPFVNMETVEQTCELIMTRQFDQPRQADASGPKQTRTEWSVTDLCRNLPETLLSECLGHLDFRMLAEPKVGVEPPPTEVPDRYGGREGVSHISGAAAPDMFWHHRRQRADSMYHVKAILTSLQGPPSLKKPAIQRLRPQIYEKLRSILDEYEDGTLTIEAALLAANAAMAHIYGDITKLVSIPLDGYTWLWEAHRRDIIYTLNTLPPVARISGAGIKREYMLAVEFPGMTNGSESIRVFGQLDFCRPSGEAKAVWEIKYMNMLQPEHLIQLAVYMLLVGKGTSGFLASARTGQTVEVMPKTPTSLHEILQLLVKAASGGPTRKLVNSLSEEEFLKEAKKEFSSFVGKCMLPRWFSKRPTTSKYKSKGKKGGGCITTL